MIVALVGRRIDAPDVETPVFPYAAVERVQRRIDHLLKDEKATALVCSAACGADLVALEAAEELGIRRRVILPFEPSEFRKTSVVDRPGNWGPVFDRVIADARSRGDLVCLCMETDGDESYIQANNVLLREALALAASSGDQVGAVMVWDGNSRGEHDVTSIFGNAARLLGCRVIEVSTL